MSRRSSFGYRLAQYQRELEREARANERATMRAAREAERARREYERARAAEEKERKRLYVESRIAEIEAMNESLEAFVSDLENLLAATLRIDDFVDFESLKVEADVDPFQPGPLAVPEPAPQLESFLPPSLSALQRLVPGAKAKHGCRVDEAKQQFAQAKAEHEDRERQREAALAQARADYDAEVARIVARTEEKNRDIDDFRARFEAGDPSAVVEYFSLVLDASSYPEGFPQRHKMACSQFVSATLR